MVRLHRPYVLEKIHVHTAKTIHNLDWYTPSNQVLALYNWFTINCLYKYRLLLLAHNCFYDFSPTAIKQLFKKYDSDYNRWRKLNFLLLKPKSELLCKFACYKVISLWNSLENHTCSIANRSMFKNTLKRRIICKELRIYIYNNNNQW